MMIFMMVFIVIHNFIWGFPNHWGLPQNGWFIMKNTMRMDDLGVPPYVLIHGELEGKRKSPLVTED